MKTTYLRRSLFTTLSLSLLFSSSQALAAIVNKLLVCAEGKNATEATQNLNNLLAVEGDEMKLVTYGEHSIIIANHGLSGAQVRSLTWVHKNGKDVLGFGYGSKNKPKEIKISKPNFQTLVEGTTVCVTVTSPFTEEHYNLVTNTQAEEKATIKSLKAQLESTQNELNALSRVYQSAQQEITRLKNQVDNTLNEGRSLLSWPK